MRAILGFLRRRAWDAGGAGGRSGAVAIVQRFGGALNTNTHFHTLALDGVFTKVGDDVGFTPAHRTRPPMSTTCSPRWRRTSSACWHSVGRTMARMGVTRWTSGQTRNHVPGAAQRIRPPRRGLDQRDRLARIARYGFGDRGDRRRLLHLPGAVGRAEPAVAPLFPTGSRCPRHRARCRPARAGERRVSRVPRPAASGRSPATTIRRRRGRSKRLSVAAGLAMPSRELV